MTEELDLDADESEIPGTSESMSSSKAQAYSESSDWPGSNSRKSSVFSTRNAGTNDGTNPVSLTHGVRKFKETAL